MKKYIILLTVILCITTTTSALAENGPYNGTITPLAVDQIKYGTNYGYRGIITYIANVGKYVVPKIVNRAGKTVRQGTLLVSMDTEYWKSQVIVAEATVLSTKESLITATENYNRNKKLSKDHSVSEKTFDNSSAVYYQAIGNLEAAKADLYQKQKVLEECNIYSSVEGIVTEKYMDQGNILGGEPIVLDITQLNPIGVKVKLSDNVINALFSNTARLLFLDNEGNRIEILDNFYRFDGNDFTFAVANQPLLKNSIKIDGNNYPVIDSLYRIRRFYIYEADNSLSVPIDAVHKDSKGEYVWKLNANPRISSRLMIANKAYFVPGDLVTLQAETSNVIIVKKAENLKINDVVLLNNTENLKDNSKVFVSTNRYKLMPGGKVKVKVIYYNVNSTPTVPKK